MERGNTLNYLPGEWDPEPASPWAEHFYPAVDPYWKSHSGLAPEFPPLDIDNYNEEPWHNMDSPLPRPTPRELDRLFFGERWQQLYLGGIKSWQLGVLNSEPYRYGPTGKDLPTWFQDPAWDRYYQDRVVPSESDWFPFFSRENWFDLRTNACDSIKNPFPEMRDHATDWWTADNEVIWDHLSVSIEMANRILKQLIEDQDLWLDALLCGPRQSFFMFDEDVRARFLAEMAYDPQILRRVDQADCATSEVLTQRLLTLNERTLFCFADESGAFDITNVYGFTWNTDQDHGEPNWTVAYIEVSLIRALCDRDTSLSERATMQNKLTVTILHELMYMWPEATLVELGASFEKNTFGGLLRQLPTHTPPLPLGGSNALLSLYTWPTQFNVGDLPAPTVDRSPLEEPYNYAIPVAWSSAMQYEAFWIDEVTKFGRKVFKAPRILRGERFGGRISLAGRTYGAHRMRINQDTPPLLKVSYEYTLAVWQMRRLRWLEMRSPWYPVDYRLWSLSPWSWIYARTCIARFKVAHSQRHQSRCLALARELLWYENYCKEVVGTADDHPILWLFVSIGSLLMATVPALSADATMIRPAKPLENFPNSRCQVAPHLISSTGTVTIHPVRLAKLATKYDTPRTAWAHPKERIMEFVNTFYAGARKHPTPKAWLEVTMNCGRAVWNRHMSGTRADEWLPFDFEVPDYDTEWAIAVDTGYSNNDLSILGWMSSNPPESENLRLVSPSPSPIIEYFDSHKLPSPNAPPKRCGMVLRKKGVKDDDDTDSESARTVKYPKHYTVSEVGNHIFKRSTWVVEPDGNLGYDVFRITKMCLKLGYSTARQIRSQLLTVGPHGPMLRIDGCEHASQIRAEFGKSIRPVGKLLVYRRYQEIAEYNGKNGMPLWIPVGINVYDVTKFSFESSQEREDLTQIHNGKPTKLPDSRGDYEELIRRLSPYRCALMAGTKKKPPPTLYPFTQKMLSWHDNPNDGCYTAIGDIVYDLTGYLECHPGGKDILIKYLGKEAIEFDNYHMTGLLDSYPEFRIGRLVPEIHQDDIQKHQVAIHEWLYDISSLAPSKSNDKRHHWAYERVSKLGGTDASEAIKEDTSTARALTQLVLEEHARIVGKIIRPGDDKLKEIPDGELPKHIDPMDPQGAWTVVDGLVYQISGIMRYGKLFYGKAIPAKYAGSTLADSALAIWLAQTFPNRVIGRLVPGPEWPECTIGGPSDAKKGLRQEAKQTALRDIEELKRQGKRIPPGMVEAANNIGVGKAAEPIRKGLVPPDIMEWATANNPTATEFKNKLRERERELEEQNAPKRKMPAGVGTSTGSIGSGRNTRRKMEP